MYAFLGYFRFFARNLIKNVRTDINLMSSVKKSLKLLRSRQFSNFYPQTICCHFDLLQIVENIDPVSVSKCRSPRNTFIIL